MKHKSPQILPCPKCKQKGTKTFDKETRRFWFECATCGVQIPMFRYRQEFDKR